MSDKPVPLYIWALLLMLGSFWGSSFMAVKIALEGFAPLQIAAIRITLAAVIVTAFAWATGRQMPGRDGSKRIWLHILGFAIFTNALPFSLLAWAQQHVTTGFAGVSMAVVPLLVLPLAHLLVPAERMSLMRVVGFVTGFIGTLILIGPDAFVRAGGSFEGLARVACVCAALSYATGSIVTRLAPPSGMVSYSAATLVVASLIAAPLALWSEGWPHFSSLRADAAVLYLAVVPTGIATLVMVTIIRTAGSTFLSLVNYQVPLWSLAFAVTLLGETLPPSILGALALILGGLAISQFGARLMRARAVR